MMIERFLLTAAALAAAVSAPAQATAPSPTPSPAAAVPLPSGTSEFVWAGNTLYVSGSLDPDLKTHTDTTSQTVGLLHYLEKLLESQKLTLGDVVMMHVYLGGEMGKPDFAGMMAGYKQFFGTKEQPNKPARTTVQVVLPAASRGALIEIDLVAVRRE